MANEIKPEQVPKEVITAFRAALKRDDTSFEADFCAALNAWPMGSVATPDAWVRCRRDGFTIILPLPPQEKQDDKA